MDKKKEILLGVGLNDLEAEVYLALLEQEELLTGYKIGKLISKPTANVYKAIDNLAKKGAVVLEDKQKGLCKAVPAQEFLAAVETGLQRKTQEAKKAFAIAPKEAYDEKNYQLHSVDLVLSKCLHLIQKAEKIVVLDAFPQPLAFLLPAITAAIKRGVEVYLQVYETVDVPGANIVSPTFLKSVLQYWQSQQLNLITDGREYVLALFNNNLTEVYQATWSRNLYLSCMFHKGFSNEYTISKIADALPAPNALEQITEILEKQSRLSSGQIPGVQELLNRFVRPE